MQGKSKYIKIMSLLLQYPDEEYLQMLPEIASEIGKLQPSREKTGIEAFLKDVKSQEAIQLQERYTATFDLNPSTTLNMTYHKWGDGEKRAAALTRLSRAEIDGGYELNTGELPDYLPLVLEFIAAVPEAQRSETVQQSLEPLETMVDRLRKIALPFAELLDPLAAIFSNSKEN